MKSQLTEMNSRLELVKEGKSTLAGGPGCLVPILRDLKTCLTLSPLSNCLK